MSETTTINVATFYNRINVAKVRKGKRMPFVVVMIDPAGGEQVLATFEYAGDAHVCGRLMANRAHPAGEWQIVARNA